MLSLIIASLHPRTQGSRLGILYPHSASLIPTSLLQPCTTCLSSRLLNFPILWERALLLSLLGFSQKHVLHILKLAAYIISQPLSVDNVLPSFFSCSTLNDQKIKDLLSVDRKILGAKRKGKITNHKL